MNILSDWVGKLKMTSAFRSAEKQEAIAVWNRGLVWDDAALKKVFADGQEGKGAFGLVAAGGLYRGVHDEGHLSVFRAFKRQEVAEHFVPLLEAKRAGHPGVTFYECWGHIEHTGFWRAAGALLNQAEGLDVWGYALDAAAYCGNLAPFVAGEPAVLQYRATNLSQLSQAGWKTKMLHPDVAKWLVDKGFWTRADIAAQVNSRTCPMDGNQFMGLPEYVACESEYVADMAESVLRDYGLSLDQTVRFVGQAMLSLGLDYWNDTLSKRIAPYIVGIEVDVLKAVCGQMVFVKDPDEQSLYNTLQKATQAPSLTFRAEHANSGMREGPCQHNGLLFLMDLDPPKDRAALYHLGAMALRVRRQQIKEPEVFALPKLE